MSSRRLIGALAACLAAAALSVSAAPQGGSTGGLTCSGGCKGKITSTGLAYPNSCGSNAVISAIVDVLNGQCLQVERHCEKEAECSANAIVSWAGMPWGTVITSDLGNGPSPVTVDSTGFGEWTDTKSVDCGQTITLDVSWGLSPVSGCAGSISASGECTKCP